MAEIDSTAVSYFLKSFFLSFTTRFGNRCVRSEHNAEAIRHRILGLQSTYSTIED